MDSVYWLDNFSHDNWILFRSPGGMNANLHHISFDIFSLKKVQMPWKCFLKIYSKSLQTEYTLLVLYV